MLTKKVFLGYYVLYAMVRFVATTIEAFSHSNLQIPVLIISEAASLIGLAVGVWWMRGKPTPAMFVRGLMGINAAAAAANILITRMNPLQPGATLLDLMAIGTLFDVVLFVAVFMIPMPETPAVAREAREPEPDATKTDEPT